MATNNGGPAFPKLDALTNDGGSRTVRFTASSAGGMSLRDYFAAQSLTTVAHLLKRETPNEVIDDPISLVARFAYKLADAMLAEREK